MQGEAELPEYQLGEVHEAYRDINGYIAEAGHVLHQAPTFTWCARCRRRTTKLKTMDAAVR